MLATKAFVILCAALCSVEALDNGLALTPPMGWNSYLVYGCDRDCDPTSAGCMGETQIKRMADLMVSEGYLAAGYEYLVIDDCWDTDIRGVPDSRRFPNGMKALAEYIHGKGLKFGILGDLDNMREFDANVAASWDVDYYKSIGWIGKNVSEDYKRVSNQIISTSRPMIIACSWPFLERYFYSLEPKYKESSEYCNTWRIESDMKKSWTRVDKIINWVGENQDDFASLAGPGQWNDPDWLAVGNTELTVEQAQIQMALWSIMAAPLIMSVDLANVRPEFKDILLNRDIIAVDQDKLGLQGRRVFKSELSKLEVWNRKLSDDCYAVAFVNLGNEVANLTLTHEEMKLPLLKFAVVDLYNTESQWSLEANENLPVVINATGVKFYKLTLYYKPLSTNQRKKGVMFQHIFAPQEV